MAAGDQFAGVLASAELFDPGLGYTSATQPQLNAVSSVSSTSALSLTGTNFTGVSEGSGGATNNSASNIPVVQLQSLVNEQVINVPLDPTHGFTSTAFTSLPPTGLVPGYALLTMFVNGTPSLSQIVPYNVGMTNLGTITFAAWEAQYPTLTDTAPSHTPEHDGVPTLFKYLYNINPTRPMTAADRAALPVFAMTTSGGNTYLTLTYGQYAFYTGITINVQISSDLQTWTTLNSTQYTIQPTGAADPNGDPYMEIEVPFTGSPQFVRMGVVSP